MEQGYVCAVEGPTSGFSDLLPVGEGGSWRTLVAGTTSSVETQIDVVVSVTGREKFVQSRYRDKNRGLWRCFLSTGRHSVT